MKTTASTVRRNNGHDRGITGDFMVCKECKHDGTGHLAVNENNESVLCVVCGKICYHQGKTSEQWDKMLKRMRERP